LAESGTNNTEERSEPEKWEERYLKRNKAAGRENTSVKIEEHEGRLLENFSGATLQFLCKQIRLTAANHSEQCRKETEN